MTNRFFEDLLTETGVIVAQGVFDLILSFSFVCWIPGNPNLILS